MQALEVVTRALRIVGVGVGGEALAAQESASGLAMLNAMLHSWVLEGVGGGHTDLDLTDEMAVPDNHIDAIVYNLAVRAAPELEGSVDQRIADLAVSTFQTLRSAYLDIDDMDMPTGLKRMPSQYWGWGGSRS